MLSIAASFLSSTGLFTVVPEAENNPFKNSIFSQSLRPGESRKDGLFNQYLKPPDYKRNARLLRSTAWTSTTQTVLLVPASVYGSDLSETSIVIGPLSAGECYSRRLTTMMREHEISNMPMLRLAPLASGLARRYLDGRDLGAFSALGQLMDAMDLDAAWCEKNLKGYPEDTIRLIESTIRGKPLRNTSLCMEGFKLRGRDAEELKQARGIRGRG